MRKSRTGNGFAVVTFPESLGAPSPRPRTAAVLFRPHKEPRETAGLCYAVASVESLTQPTQRERSEH